MIRKAVGILRTGGQRELARRGIAFAYRRGIRPWLPAASPVRYAGLPVAVERKWWDGLVPQEWTMTDTRDHPGYEEALVTALKENVLAGDQVVIVGGGVGVTAAIAALQAGDRGRVTCFEGGAEGVMTVRRTAALNRVQDRVTVRHAIVGRSVHVYGTPSDQGVLPPEELPECDVLELDCEGAEVEILSGMVIRPRVLLVETHGMFGAPTSMVLSLVERLGYRPHVIGLAEPRVAEYCQENDIQVIAATRGAT